MNKTTKAERVLWMTMIIFILFLHGYDATEEELDLPLIDKNQCLFLNGGFVDFFNKVGYIRSS